MTTIRAKCQSALDGQLTKEGTTATQNMLMTVVKNLPKCDVFELDEELSFYGETGLIGVQMSRLLQALCTRVTSRAA